MNKILIIGYSSRNIVASARRAGYEVYAIDAFCDQDLLQLSQDCYKLDDEDVHEINPEKLAAIIRGFNVAFDAVVLGSGFELTNRSIFDIPVLNNNIKSMEKVSDKKRFANELESLGIPHPHTWNAETPPDISTPMILKPRCGGGGVFNRVVDSEDSFERAAEEIAGRNPNLSKKNIILQEFVPGIPASVSVISTGKEAISIAVNEQLIGIPWLTRMPFAYCGNITPFETQYKDEMMNIAEQLCKHFGLIGSNGIDFLITEKGVVVLEINARFQGSLDSVELATGFNLFEAHRNAFAGILPQKPSADKYAARTVVYAYGNPLHINKKLTSFRVSGKFADIPKAGHISMSDEPILSIMEEGQSRQEILDKLYLTCQALRNTMSEV